MGSPKVQKNIWYWGLVVEPGTGPDINNLKKYRFEEKEGVYFAAISEPGSANSRWFTD